jgi:hypothetical protein
MVVGGESEKCLKSGLLFGKNTRPQKGRTEEKAVQWIELKGGMGEEVN